MVPMAINDSSNTATLTHRVSIRTGGAEIGTIKATKIAIGRNDTSISAGNTIGGLEFYGNDANGTFVNTASIIVNADGDHGNDDKPTRMQFFTTADGGSSASERMRITSAGKVNIGDTQMSSNLLNIEDATAAAIDFASHGTGGDTAYIGVKKSAGGGLTFGISNRDFIFKTGATYSNGTTFDSGSERMPITIVTGKPPPADFLTPI